MPGPCGTAVPLLIFTGLILSRSNLLDARYAIPIGGMILGNCLRVDIIGIRTFYNSMRTDEKTLHNRLAQGALLEGRPQLDDPVPVLHDPLQEGGDVSPETTERHGLCYASIDSLSLESGLKGSGASDAQFDPESLLPQCPQGL